MKTRVFPACWWYLTVLVLTMVGPAFAQDPNSTVTIYATDPQASEAWSDTGTFTVRRSGGTNHALLVFYRLSGTASNGVDYERLGGTVQIPAGAAAASFNVKPIDDALVEGTETVLAEIVESPMMCITCGYRIGTPSVAEVLIRDNDPEGTNHPPFVQLNEPRNGDVFTAPANITLRAYAQDAEDGYDLEVEFFEGPRSLGFGTFVATLCPAPYCPYYELTWSNVPPGSYELTARATDSHAATSVSNPAHITVEESNRPPGVNIYATDPIATEQPAVSTVPPDTATFTVRRSGDSSDGIVVFYEIGGTASNGVDYQRLSGHVTLPPGASSAEIVVDPIDDNLAEGTEAVVLTLKPPCPQCLFANPPCDVPQGTNCFQIGPDNQATAYIRDNDPPPTNHPPFVQLNEPRDGATFTAPAEITLRAYAQDTEDGYFLQVEFFEGPRSLGFGTFVPTRCATPYCPYYELIWSNVPPGRYELTAKATDSGGASSVSNPAHITVVEGSGPPGVNIYATDPVGAEQPAASNIPPDTATFTVRRSGDTSDGIVVFYEISGTASNGVDYQRLSGRVTLPAGASSAEIAVEPIDDNLPEATETVVLTLIAPCPQCLFANPPCLVPQGTNCFQIGPDNRATAYLRDNGTTPTNPPPVVSIVARDPIAVEGPFCRSNWWWTTSWNDGGWVTTPAARDPNSGCSGTNTALFVVHRSGPTNADLIVNYEIGGTASNGMDYRALSGSATIPAGKRSAQIVVTPIEDTLAEGVETVVLKLQPSPNYAVGSPARASAMIVDNDRPRPPCRVLPDRQFHFCRPATNGYCYRMEASTDLLHWTPLCTNMVTDGAIHFIDPDAASLNARFYRARPEPALPPDD